MIYNQPSTVYYIAAQKLSALAKYYFSEQYLMYLRHSVPFGNDVPLEKLGITPKPKERIKVEPKKNPARNAIIDNMNAAAILKSVNKNVKVGDFGMDHPFSASG